MTKYHFGETIDDYISTFAVSATEITDDDLTNSITIDDSAVDFNTPGSYNIIFKVSDNEGNKVQITGSVVIKRIHDDIADGSSEIPDEVITEDPSDVIVDTISIGSKIDASDIDSDISTIKETNNVLTEDKQQLTSTGNMGSVLVVAFMTMVAMLFTIKKKLVSSN